MKFKGSGFSLMVEHLHSMHEAHSSISSTEKKVLFY
jgi:hypothetical protein